MSIAEPRRRVQAKRYDVVVAGGGPAGAVAAWALANQGISTIILDRARFPREKVCGDFVEPRGLRIFDAMGCLTAIEKTGPLPITHTSIFISGRPAFRGRIPFYGRHTDLPRYGYIIPRETLDHILLSAAVNAGAELREGWQVDRVERLNDAIQVHRRGTQESVSASMVIGADGTASTVARSVGLYSHDPRYVAISQRAYAEGVRLKRGEAVFWFDSELFPGYGWMFPMAQGRANLGVGVLAEAVNRYSINVPQLFQKFVDSLRLTHPDCGGLRLISKPIGGIVRTYGSAGPNHFDGGILVGDAGCFVDPMTGEGITPAAESALLGASVIAQALVQGRRDRVSLEGYERAFRAYFDPSMGYLDFCACLMRNRHMAEFWFRTVRYGCSLATTDPEFARVSGATFGGLDVRPFAIGAQLWAKTPIHVLSRGARVTEELCSGQFNALQTGLTDTYYSHAGLWASWIDDPIWHLQWAADLARKWLTLMRTTTIQDPRAVGVLNLNKFTHSGQRDSRRVSRTSRTKNSGLTAKRTASASASAARASK